MSYEQENGRTNRLTPAQRYELDSQMILEFFTTREILGDGIYFGEGDAVHGDWTDGPAIWYLESLYIDIMEDHYDLVLGSEEWESRCLERLEIKLAEFAVDEGIIDRDEFLTRRDEILGRNIGKTPEEYLDEDEFVAVHHDEYRGCDYGDDE